MPLREPSIFMFERPCQNPECVHSSMMVAEDEHDGSSIGTCANDVMVLIQWIRDAGGVPGACVACGHNEGGTLKVDDGDWVGRLCRGHAIAYFAHALDVPSFWAVVEDAGGDPEKVHALHGDFYADGYAWQPYPIGSEMAAEYVRMMDELPGFDEEGEYALEPADYRRLLDLMQAGYREVTGLDLEDFTAEAMFSRLIMGEQFRRSANITDKVALFRDGMLEIAARLYREVDPQGLVRLHGEAGAETYRVNARDLVARMHGESRDVGVDRMSVKVAQSFGDLLATPSDQSPEMRRLAERLVAELAEPIAKLADAG